MRILAIRGANLASLKGPFEVDLERPPLCHLGLFAIAGPVGAGKSTLLDAMCLALFNRTPRLSGRGGSPLSKDGDALRANDPRSLVRRGVASAFAEVDFSGTDGRVWRARWTVRRARGQAFGRLQDEVMTLVDAVSGERAGDGKEDTLENIKEKLGLTFDECCRSVLLAQGGFSSFLKAKADERAALLEKITGTHLYSTLSIRSYERARDEQASLRALEDELAAMPPASDDERAALHHTVDIAAAARAAAEVVVERAEALRRHDERAAIHAGSTQAAREALDVAVAARDGSAEAKAVVALERVWPARPLLRASLAAADTKRDADLALVRAVDDERRARAALDSARERRARADEAFAQRARALADAEPALARAVVLDEQIVRTAAGETIDAHARAAADLAEIDAALEALATTRAVTAGDLHRAGEVLARAPELTALVPAWPAVASDLAQLAACDTELEGARAVADAALRNGEEARARLRTSVDAVEMLVAQARAAHARIDAVLPGVALDDAARALTEAAGENMRRRAMLESAGRAATRVEELRAILARAVDEERAATAARDHAEAAVATALRAHLEDGAPCPVCGSAEHPAVDRARAHAERVARGDVADDAAVATAEGDGHALGTHRSLVDAEGRRAAAAARALELRAALAHAEAEAALIIVPAAAPVDDGAVAAGRAALAEARRIGDALRVAETARQENEAELLVEEQAAALHLRVVEDRARVRADRSASLARRLPAATDLAAPRALLAAMKPRIEGLRAQQEAVAAAAAALAQSEPALRALENRRAAAAEREATLARAANEARRHHDELLALRAALFAGEPAAGVRARLTAGLEEGRTAAADGAAALAAAEVRAADAAVRRDGARDIAAAALARDAEAAAAVRALAIDIDDVARAAALDDNALDDARTALRALENAVARAEAVLAERSATEGAHRAARPEDGDVDVDQARAALSAATDAWAAARAALAHDDAARERAASLLPRLTAQRERALTWQRLADVIGSADGARFRVFAQSLTLDALLVHANAHLKMLAPRYRLERARPVAAGAHARFDLDLVVVDRESGDEPRSVASLSGGETFLVSLALALGLSSLSAARTSVESLFIDEGFSSLDPETLEAALAALEALRATGRQIGVISHVPALVERIGAQVRVVPLGGGRSRVDISHTG